MIDVGLSDGPLVEPGQTNAQSDPVLPTHEPSGHCFASAVQAIIRPVLTVVGVATSAKAEEVMINPPTAQVRSVTGNKNLCIVLVITLIE